MATTQQPLAPWLTKRLIADGTLTPDRVTRRPTIRACRHCTARLIVAIESGGTNEPCSRIELDPVPLTPLGEAQATVAGVGTFDYNPGCIWWRDPFRIAGVPADITTVMAEHRCGSPPLDAKPHPPPAPKKTPLTIPTEPPY